MGVRVGLQANELLGSILSIDECPFVRMPEIPFPPEGKVPAIDAFVVHRAAAWIDDALGDAVRRWAANRSAPTLLLDVDGSIGLTRGHVDELLRWADHLNA